MSGIKGNKKHANKTSYPNQKRNDLEPKVVLRQFNKMVENAHKDDDILCWQDACTSVGWRVGKCDYWANKIPRIGALKTEVNQIVIRRVNRMALKEGAPAAASIWRMKQSGEKDEQTFHQNITPKTPEVVVQDQDTADELNKLKE